MPMASLAVPAKSKQSWHIDAIGSRQESHQGTGRHESLGLPHLLPQLPFPEYSAWRRHDAHGPRHARRGNRPLPRSSRPHRVAAPPGIKATTYTI